MVAPHPPIHALTKPTEREGKGKKDEEWKNGLQLNHSSCISPIGFTSSVPRHLDEFGVDGLIGLAKDRDEVSCLLHVARSEEGVGRSSLLTTRRAPNAVNIIFRVVGVVIVDNELHVFHICDREKQVSSLSQPQIQYVKCKSLSSKMCSEGLFHVRAWDPEVSMGHLLTWKAHLWSGLPGLDGPETN